MFTRQSCGLSGLTILITIMARVQSSPVSTTAEAHAYLQKYGYLEASAQRSHNGALFEFNTWTKALSNFQNFTGLNTTGELNNETMQLMSLPRCGVRDQLNYGNGKRLKRYSIQGDRWRVKDLTYNITRYPETLRKADVEAEIARAFAIWSKYTDLTFTHKKTGPVHIEIKFVTGKNGDGKEFDGKGGDLAHANSPIFGGTVYFDRDEIWTIDGTNGTDLFYVAAHEFGHSLGLNHSYVRSALMAPFYYGYKPNFKLNSDDIFAIKALYGKNTSQTDKDRQTDPSGGLIFAPQPARPNDTFRADHKADAVFNATDGDAYILKGDLYYKMNSEGLGAPGYISEGWPGLPDNIDAAFTFTNGKTYFFKGHQYWVCSFYTMDDGYPRKISEKFKNVPNNLDAALYWSEKDKIFFFKNDEFITFDPNTKKFSPAEKISTLGLPNNLDAAYENTKGDVWFFKDHSRYKISYAEPDNVVETHWKALYV